MPLLTPRLPEGEHFGVLAEFGSPRELLQACERVRDAGYTRWDAHSPFPVHGLDQAMGLAPSRLPWLCLVFGLSGAIGGMALQIWANGITYPLIVSGKPFLNWQPYVPVTFELGVLFAAGAAVVGMLGLNQLPMYFHPLFSSERFERVTDDAFFISIEAWDPKFDLQGAQDFLRELGARHVEAVKRS